MNRELEIKFKDKEGKEIKIKPHNYLIICLDGKDINTLCEVKSYNNMQTVLEEMEYYKEKFFKEIDKLNVMASDDNAKIVYPYYLNNDFAGFKKACETGEIKGFAPEDVEMMKLFFEKEKSKN